MLYPFFFLIAIMAEAVYSRYFVAEPEVLFRQPTMSAAAAVSAEFKWQQPAEIFGTWPATRLEQILDTVDGTPYRVVWGNLHAHTAWSDGSGDPSVAYAYARDQARLDFMAVTDHPEYWVARGNDDYWAATAKAAEFYSNERFVGLRGYEYSHPVMGHLVVLNSESYCSAWSCYSLSDFYDWLARPEQEHALAIFAHPGFPNPVRDQFEFDQLALHEKVRSKIVGMEVMHWSGYQPFLKGYRGILPFYDEGLQRGWHLAPLGSQDNHSPNWGLGGSNLVGMLVPELTEAALLDALKDRRVYATNRRGLQLAFAYIGSGEKAWMGSPVAINARDPQVSIGLRLQVFDPHPDSEPVRVQLILNGVSIHEQILQQVDVKTPKFLVANYQILTAHLPESAYVYVRIFSGASENSFSQSAAIQFQVL